MKPVGFILSIPLLGASKVNQNIGVASTVAASYFRVFGVGLLLLSISQKRQLLSHPDSKGF
jgi:hypothetical protein